MGPYMTDLNAPPIRVVLFGGGPTLELGARQFIACLSEHPDIDFLAGYLQPGLQPFRQIVADLWQRRGLLAGPLLFALLLDANIRFLTRFRSEKRLNRSLNQVSDRLHSVSNIHADDVLKQVKDLAPDLGLIYGSPILKPSLFQIPRFGTLGIHHGKVPQYRGKKTTFWAIYNGESTAGVTIQKINAKLDAGEIVREGAVPIGRRSRRAIWQELEALGIDLYLQAIIEVKNGTAQYRPQLGPKGPLYRDPRFAELLRFWLRQLSKKLGKLEDNIGP